VFSLSIDRIWARLIRVPLNLIPRRAVVPILSGRLMGKRWIVGSGIHRCWLGFYERSKQDLIARIVKSNSVFYDVGANVGIYSLLASMLVGSGKVFAFEPLPRNMEFLSEHLRLNAISNVELVPVAVSDKVGSAQFDVEATGYMGHLTSNGGGLQVHVETLDSLVSSGRILPPDYIKMDIEGAEILALHGASETFKQHRPTLFLATHGQDVRAECWRLLESWGYECKALGATVDEKGDIVAVPRGTETGKGS
jgi:FkbM family methyltransferase